MNFKLMILLQSKDNLESMCLTKKLKFELMIPFAFCNATGILEVCVRLKNYEGTTSIINDYVLFLVWLLMTLHKLESIFLTVVV